MPTIHDRKRTWRSAVVLVLGVLGASCQVAPPAAPTGWPGLVDAFVETHFAMEPTWAVWAGRHEFDGRLPDWSEPALRREIAQLHAVRDRAVAFDPTRLDAAQRLEREQLLAVIDSLLFEREVSQDPWRSPAFYEGSLGPDIYVSRAYAPLAQRLRAYIDYARAVPRAVEQMRANLRTPMPRTFVARGHLLATGLASFYENDAAAVFAPVADARLQAEFASANGAAIRAMRELDAWFTQRERDADDRFALGEATFLRMLRDTERVDVPLATLRAAAERDLARNLAALDAACAAVAPGRGTRECVHIVQADKGQASTLDEARSQLAMLESFLAARPIVTLGFAERAQVGETPAYARWNLAQIDIPGPLEKGLPSTYQIAPPDPAWSEQERAAYLPGRADLLFISVHEVWPGHFVQFMRARNAPSLLGRVFGSYAYGEGWAHYCEEMMWDAGLGDGDPRIHVGQLLNALLRNVRWLSAIGLHTGTMTLEQSERLFREQAFQDAANARQQAARGTVDPGYGNYTLGKLMITKLRDDWVATRGGRAAWKDFHDAFLARGSMPVPLLRQALLGEAAGPPL